MGIKKNHILNINPFDKITADFEPSRRPKYQKYFKGFTLIELVIGFGIISISLPVIFGLFFINLQAQSRIYILQEVKRNGDYALNIMQTTLKQYAQQVTKSDYTTEACPVLPSPTPIPTSSAYFIDKYGKRFSYYLDSLSIPNKISSQSPTILLGGNNISNWYLTNDKVKVNNLSFTCYKTNIYSPPIVEVSFTVSQAGTQVRYEEIASLNYQTKIKLKSY